MVPSFLFGIVVGTTVVARILYQVGTLLQLHVVNFAFYRGIPSSVIVLSTKLSIQKKNFKN